MVTAETSSDRPAGIRSSAGFTPELEGLRGVAALLVVAYHCDALLRPLETSPPAGLLAPLRAFVFEGHTGVTLFFVLSAFLLSRPFLAGARSGRAPSVTHFLERRALRILPLYGLAVVVATALLASSPADLLHGLPYLLFLNANSAWVTSLYPYSAAWWSLATEAQFYLLLPLGGVLAASRPGRLLLAGAALAYAAALFAFDTHRLGANEVEPQLALCLSVFGRGSAFLGGIAAAWLCERHGPRIRDAAARSLWMRRGGADLLLAALVLALGLLLQRVAQLGFWVAETAMHAWHVPEALLWSAVLLVVLLLPLRSRAIFAGRLLGWIGVISYSVYLWHYPILKAVLAPLHVPGRGGPGLTPRSFAVACLGLALTAAVSVLTYRFVERPFLVRKARIEG